jgi:hypothetical protein
MTKSDLIPAKKGEVRNINGRGKGHLNRATVARKWLDVITKTKNPATGQMEPATIEDQVMLSLIKRALKGDPRAIELVFEMKYGKAVQPMDLQVDMPNIELIRADKTPQGKISRSEQDIEDE